MQHQLVWMPRRHSRMPFGPIVRYGVGEDGAVAVKGRGGYRARRSFEG